MGVVDVVGLAGVGVEVVELGRRVLLVNGRDVVPVVVAHGGAAPGVADGEAGPAGDDVIA